MPEALKSSELDAAETQQMPYYETEQTLVSIVSIQVFLTTNAWNFLSKFDPFQFDVFKGISEQQRECVLYI